MRKAGKLLLLLLAIGVLLTVGAFASAEPSGEPSGEMLAEASGEPSPEPAAESFELTILVNGDTFDTVAVGVSVEGNVYTFDLADLFASVGLTLSYDEETDIAAVGAEAGSLMESLLTPVIDAAKASGEVPGASEEPPASGETAASEEPIALDEADGLEAPASDLKAMPPASVRSQRICDFSKR